MKVISTEDAQKVLYADINNIVAKVKAGKTLTKSERGLFEKHTGSFTGTESLRALAKRYGTSHRAIDDLKKSGVDVNDPEQVILQLSRNLNWVPPEEFKTVGKKKGKAKKTPNGNVDPGLRAAIERLRQAELEAHDKFKHAQTLAEEQRYLKVWTSVLDQLRKIEESQPDIESQNNQIVTKEELAIVLGGLFKNLRQDMDTLPARIALLGQNCKEEILEAIVEAEVAKIIDSLKDCTLIHEKV